MLAAVSEAHPLDPISHPVLRRPGGPPPMTPPADLRAASFIVTLYGDVAEPRGGLLWMGTVVEICARAGISETRARTAVSRLMAGGRLEGSRAGRRSYYRLTPAARAEFAAAAALIFDPPPPADRWLIAALGEGGPPAGFAPLGPGLALGPERAGAPPALFRAEAVGGTSGGAAGGAGLRALAARLWDLERPATAYAVFLEACPDAPPPGEGEAALLARLMLVHRYRAAALSDPQLPAAALPTDWPGGRARRRFVSQYLALSEAADSHVGRAFLDLDGPLPRSTAAVRARLRALQAEAERAPTA